MSSQPSPSASKTPQPGPSVSGSHFLPSRPELCSKWIPTCTVTSVNRTVVSSVRGGAVRHEIRHARPKSVANGRVIVDRLSFIVVLRAHLSWAGGQLLRGLVGFEAPEQGLLVHGVVRLSQPSVAEHQVVMSLHVFRIDRQDLFQCL